MSDGTSFILDRRLEADSIFICDLPLCRVMLHSNAVFPWLILVPRRDGLVEITDLSQEEQLVLLKEVNLVSKSLQQHTQAYKMNIAALGNQVRQLHVHVVARFQEDPAWPGVVWGAPSVAYDNDKLNEIKNMMKRVLVEGVAHV